ncbi:Chromatin structure-remodeling complex protein rsc9 [Xanthoria calcicola]
MAPSDEVESLQLDNLTFLKRLATFHQQRGTALDAAPRVNNRPIELQKLYHIVLDHGGYDEVSRAKLAWRKVGQAFGLGTNNAAAYAFALKTVYYKNLAAFEIKDRYNREPPPKEILEHVTARGGDLLNRTVENYSQPSIEDAEPSGDDEVTTPNGGDKMDLDDPGSGPGRSSRGLRQAPPQRVLFQPDLSSSRQTRTATGHGQSPQPTTAPTAAHNGPSLPHSISSYEPRPPFPLTLRGVTTPANNSTRFYQQMNQQHIGLKRKAKNVTEPGSGFDGPNIYVRTLQALKSGIPGEIRYALHHLVKISHERGDKFRFEAFPGLAEALIEYIMGITSEYYAIHWHVSYMEDVSSDEVLDAINGTPKLPEKMQRAERVDFVDELWEPESVIHFENVMQAGLATRNLLHMEENAQYLVRETNLARDMLTIILNLPHDFRLTELRHYMWDIAECLVPYWVMPNPPKSDPLYRLLLSEIQDSPDRGAIVTCIRTLCRISMNLTVNNNISGVPAKTINKIVNWCLLQDEELVGAALDFLYQYTANPVNVALLLYTHKSWECPLPPLLSRMSSLLRHGELETQAKVVLQHAIPEIPAETIPNIPADLLQKLLQMDEPERSNVWLKCVFEEHKDSEITQIALWHAYQARFLQHSSPAASSATGLLPAAEFIKNVSIIFESATAQVVNGVQNKFIIKGIRPRRHPTDPRHHIYHRCMWKSPGQTIFCSEYLPNAEALKHHLWQVHCGLKYKEGSTTQYSAEGTATPNPRIDCHWNGNCHRLSEGVPKLEPTIYNLVRHMPIHIAREGKDVRNGQHHKTGYSSAANHHHFVPNTLGPRGVHDPRFLADAKGLPISRSEVDPEGKEAVWQYMTYYNTPVDEKGEPCGLSHTAALVLRNIARHVVKANAMLRDGDFVGKEGVSREDLERWMNDEENAELVAERGAAWMERLFRGEVWDGLCWVMSYNRSLGPVVADVLALVKKGMDG